MSPEVVHARADFREHLGLRFLERERQLQARRPPVAATAEPGSELGRVDLITAPNADLGQARAGLFEQDGMLLAADPAELTVLPVPPHRGRGGAPRQALAALR